MKGMNMSLVRLAKKYNVRAGVKDTDYPYYHITNYPKPPRINPKSTYNDPSGIYLFIKGEAVGYVAGAQWRKRKYRFDAKLKSNIRWLDIKELPNHFMQIVKKLKLTWDIIKTKVEQDHDICDDCNDLHQFFFNDTDRFGIEDGDLHSLANAFHKHSGHFFLWSFLRAYLEDGKAFTKLLKSLGYDGVRDIDEGYGTAIFFEESQVIVFDPSKIEWGEREDNDVFDEVYML